ncbi:oxidative stress defense protein [Sebaldella termitidis]|uniref:SIMPL domain-containing protein n=1 Tax=Sebaldella termitidis (strain ATCC 33386 / NCTC 11300) TaxID=526218 RepID=D1AKJ3_SEBTE|nr:SIMPL domain-containing protein [Sebaldella termitidis]ACZ09109.1 protein of unknown function DUF541 [Sebaldella termitidis ATCC 33386]SUI24427.1 oxidative stress defense protein [Sebaldella termitidis]
MKRVQFVLVAVILSLGLIISSAIVSNTIESLKKKDDVVTVKGVADKKVKSDKGILAIVVKSSDKDINTAVEHLKTNTQNIADQIKAEGFEDSEIKLENIVSEPVYYFNDRGNQTTRILSYNATQMIVITTDKVDKLDPLALKLSENIELAVSEPQYFVTNIEKLKIDLLGEATKNARLRANELLKNNGRSIGGVKTVNQGVFQITGDNTSETSDTGYYDTYSIEKTVRAVISIEYRIE